MAYTMEEFVREARQRFLQELTPEERRAVLDQLPPEERLRGLGPEERLRGLGPEELRQLEEYLKTLHTAVVRCVENENLCNYLKMLLKF